MQVVLEERLRHGNVHNELESTVTQRVVHRPARRWPRASASEPLQLPAAPLLSERRGPGVAVLQVALPLLAGSGVFMLVARGQRAGGLIIGVGLLAAMLLGALALVGLQMSGAARRLRAQRTAYLALCRRLTSDVRATADAERARALHLHPAPKALLEVCRSPGRRWERRRRDDDFLEVRLGVGTGRMQREFRVGGTSDPLNPPDPVALAAARRVQSQARVVGLPVTAPLVGTVSILGTGEEAANVLRALVCQLVAFHSPQDVRLALLLDDEHDVDEWGFLKWLPHALSPSLLEGPAPRRLLARTADELRSLLADELAERLHVAPRGPGSGAEPEHRPWFVVVLLRSPGRDLAELLGLQDGTDLAGLGVTAVHLVQAEEAEPESVDVRVEVPADGSVRVHTFRPRNEAGSARATEGAADVVGHALAVAVARTLCPLRLSERSKRDFVSGQDAGADFNSLLGIDDPETYNVEHLWTPRPYPVQFRGPVGLDDAGSLVLVDLKESADRGMGPHGICVGAIGSGKSEFLRTLTLSLAVLHPPGTLAFVLVDYKGGATFSGLEELPHTAAVVTNLEEDLGLVDRLYAAIAGEVLRRQRAFKRAHAKDLKEYARKRRERPKLEELPRLLLVIDEFGELLVAKPEFLDLFLAIGRTGRSVGLHLLLASQRLEERVTGLDSYLQYRIALRTDTSQDSNNVIGSPEAFTLPSYPGGDGYLKVRSGPPLRFHAAYVSGPARTAAEFLTTPLSAVPVPYTACASLAPPAEPAGRPLETEHQHEDPQPSLLDVVVRRLRTTPGHHRVRQVWLPPLPGALPLTFVVGELTATNARGLTVGDLNRHGRLRVPVGLVDQPAQQWQGPLEIDVSGAQGNVCVLGAPQSGKSVFLQTFVVSMALTHTPQEAQFYCLDLGGVGLRDLQGLPHVADVASRMQPDHVRRIVEEVLIALQNRETLFSSASLHSATEMRRRHRDGDLTDLPSADIFLVVDNYQVLRSEYEELVDAVEKLATRGLNYGVHVVVTASRWADLRAPIQSAIGHKLELRLNEPAMEATIDRHASATISPDTPGRCVLSRGLLAQLALPSRNATRLKPYRAGDEDEDEQDHEMESGHRPAAHADLTEIVADIAAAWQGPRAKPVTVLPEELGYDQMERKLAGSAAPRPGQVIGVNERDQPVTVDLLGSDRHVIVIGDTDSGKTNLARVLIKQLLAQYPEEYLTFFVIDPRGALADEVPAASRGGSASATQAGEMALGLRKLLQDRVSAVQAAKSSDAAGQAWSDQLVVVVDDYEQVASVGVNPMGPLEDFLTRAEDLGLHVVVLRHSGGSGTAMYAPFLKGLKDAGAAAVLLSGDSSEGPLWTRTSLRSLPPGRAQVVRRGLPNTLVQTAHVQ